MGFRDNRFLVSGLLLLVVAFFAVQLTTLDVFERDYDEGVYVAQSYLVSEGYTLYEPVDSALPPFFIWWLAGLFAGIGGPSIFAGRLLVVISGALGILSMAWIGKQLAVCHSALRHFGKLSASQAQEPFDRLRAPPGSEESRFATVAAVGAAFLLATFPRWVLYGQVAMADIPSLSFSLLAVALALKGWQKGRRWFFWGGVAAGIAMGLKFLAAYTAPLLALIVLLSYRATRPFTLPRFVWDGLATLGGFLLPLVAALPFLNVERAYETVVHFHWASARDWIDRPVAFELMAVFHWEHVGWTVLALVGLGYLAYRRMWRVLALLIGWELLIVVMLSEHAPLWGHLLLPLVSPVIQAGGIALAEGVLAWRRRAWRGLAPVLASVLLFGLLLPRARDADQASTVPIPDEEAVLLESEVIPWLRTTVPENEFLLTDSPMIAVRTGRLVVPDKTDTSFTKLFSGFLTAEDLIGAAEEQQPAAIIFWTDRFRSQKKWRQWVEEHYLIGYEQSPTRRIFIRPDLANEE